MKIRDFFDSLDFAQLTLSDDNTDDVKSFEFNFDDIMRRTAQYIRRIIEVKKKDMGKDDSYSFSIDELNDLVMEDYDRILDETYQNNDIYSLGMKYNATKHIAKHREIIPELKDEIQRWGLEFSEQEVYTDNFHDNLVTALLAVQTDYDETFSGDEIQAFDEELNAAIEANGREKGFKQVCDKYSKMKMLNLMLRRQAITYFYYKTFGVEGIDDSIPGIANIKQTNGIKEYADSYLSRLKPIYKQELTSSVSSLIRQLDYFGEIDDKIEYHNAKMKRIGLPGLGYESDTAEFKGKLPNARELLRDNSLNDLDIDVLLRMNSFYNNRFAKILGEYALSLFMVEELGILSGIAEGKDYRKDNFNPSIIKSLFLKYQTLVIPIKSYTAEIQNEVETNPLTYSDQTEQVDFGEQKKPRVKEQVMYDIQDFIDALKDVWGDNYRQFFDSKLPGVDNDLESDVLFLNHLYNPIFLSYRFKNAALKSEYAYLHCLAEENPDKPLNFGVVVTSEERKKVRKKTVLLASDGGLNLPNRLHTPRREFLDFIKSYTGTPLARVYEGFSDFIVGGEYISSQILVPLCKTHSDYMRNLEKGYLAQNGDTQSRSIALNEKFIDHIKYLASPNEFMKKYTVPVEEFDKKGKLKGVINKQQVRYIDLKHGRIYIKEEDGKLVEKLTGRVFGENRRVEQPKIEETKPEEVVMDRDE